MEYQPSLELSASETDGKRPKESNENELKDAKGRLIKGKMNRDKMAEKKFLMLPGSLMEKCQPLINKHTFT